MKKSDLKTGMRVKIRRGEIFLVIKDVDSAVYEHQDVAFIRNGGFLRGSSYAEDLRYNSRSGQSQYDIIEVFTIRGNINSLLVDGFLDLDERYSIWKRPERIEEQKETFKALKVLGYKFIARDKDGCLTAYKFKPDKGAIWWYGDCKECELEKETFDFIKWEDTEPFEIP